MAQRGHILDQQARRQIKLGRERKDLTQQALGELLGVGQVTVARWETGTRTVDTETLDRICEALDLTWEASRVIILPK